MGPYPGSSYPVASGEALWSYPLGAAVTDVIPAGRTVYAVAADSAIYAFVP